MTGVKEENGLSTPPPHTKITLLTICINKQEVISSSPGIDKKQLAQGKAAWPAQSLDAMN